MSTISPGCQWGRTEIHTWYLWFFIHRLGKKLFILSKNPKSQGWWRTLGCETASSALRIENSSVELYICASCFFPFFHRK